MSRERDERRENVENACIKPLLLRIQYEPQANKCSDDFTNTLNYSTNKTMGDVIQFPRAVVVFIYSPAMIVFSSKY
jgi:hypothetical protein